MSLPDDALRASYASCRRMAQQSGSSFYASFLGLPRPKRAAMDALYAFMRHTDDLADRVVQPIEARRQALERWREVLRSVLPGSALAAEKRPLPAAAVACDAEEESVGRELLPALADAVGRYHIPPEHLRAVIDGVEMDLTRRRYETFDQLEGYCEQVASAVGVACIHIWGFHDRQALEPARKCGIALQLTNILRDLKEDAAQDRVYLPLADLQQCGYTVDDLRGGVADERFDRLMDYQIARAEWFYRQGAELLGHLEADGQRAFGMMMATYRALLSKIKRAPRAVLRGRISLSRREKLKIAARWTLLPPRAAALL